jgi:hypothetical protein
MEESITTNYFPTSTRDREVGHLIEDRLPKNHFHFTTSYSQSPNFQVSLRPSLQSSELPLYDL